MADNMLSSLCRYLKPMVYKSNSTIIRAHTLGTRMYFVQVSAWPCVCCPAGRLPRAVLLSRHLHVSRSARHIALA
jgi:hypothetical protein